jgi:magnesium-transporting ATPase (P-type)
MRDGQWVARGDPMEAALHAFARRVGVDVAADEEQRPTVRRHPFDPKSRRMSIAIGDELIVKGAPDAILPSSRHPAEASATVDDWASRGLRVLGVAARRPLSAIASSVAGAAADSDLMLLGLIALEDPPRKAAASAVAVCRGAGIRVGMVTGDHPATARAVARQVGLGSGPVFEGKDLPEDQAALGALLDRDGVVVARVSPEDKLRIARALQQRGHVVAMTGDGVNDGPALQQADTGIAMGKSGTDVAREAADLVLLDDDFSTIIAAIEHGRATFANIRRFLTYHLTDNIAELAPFAVWALSAGRFPLALGVLQILCLDLVTDQLPALALGTEPPAPGALSKPPSSRHLVDRLLLVRALLVLGVAEAATSLAAFGLSLVQAGGHHGTPVAMDVGFRAASGAAFAAVVLGQVGNAFACRSDTRPVWDLRRRSNRLLVAAVCVEILLLVASLTIAPLARVLGQAVPPSSGWVVAILAAPFVLTVDALHKWLRMRARHRVARSSRWAAAHT